MNKTMAPAAVLSVLLHAVVLLLVPAGGTHEARPESGAMVVFTHTDSPQPAGAARHSGADDSYKQPASAANETEEQSPDKPSPPIMEDLGKTAGTEIVAAAHPGGAPDRTVYLSTKQALLTLLEQRKTYPRRARDKGIQGNVGLTLTLDAAGRAEQLDIRRSSGSSLLDNAALDLVRTSLPFPHGLGTTFHTTLTIAYRLKD